MAKAISQGGRLRELSAIIGGQMHQFVSSEEEERGYPFVKDYGRSSVATRVGKAAVGAGAILGGKALYDNNKDAIKKGAKDAAFTGMRKTAEGLNSAGNAGSRIARRIGKAAPSGFGGELVQKAGARIGQGGGLLKKTGKRLRKASMRFFSADLAATMVRIERKVTSLESGNVPVEFGSAGVARLRRVEGALAKKFKGAGVRAERKGMKNVWAKSNEKFSRSHLKKMQRHADGTLPEQAYYGSLRTKPEGTLCGLLARSGEKVVRS